MTIQEVWKLIDDALYYSGGFLDGSYIDKYPREDDTKYRERQKIAYYKNDFLRKVTRYIGYIYRKQPVREVNENELLKLFLKNCDFQGNNLTTFMSSFAKEAKAKGVGVVLIDNVEEIPTTLEEQLKTRALPYLINIKPENIVDYKLDIYGAFEYVAFNYQIDNSVYGKKDVKSVIKYFDKEKWAIYENDKIIETREHNLGVCPIIFFSETGKFESIGEFSPVAFLGKRQYNLTSEEDELIRGQTFSILIIQGEAGDLEIGTHNALFYSGDKEPKFIAPSAENAKIIKEKIDRIDDEINEITYDIITLKANNDSGRALKMKLDGLNSSLSDFAQRLENFENKIFAIVKKYLGLENLDVSVSYNKSYNIIDVSEEINELAAMKEIVDLPSYEREKLKKIIKSDLHLDDKEFEEIKKDIDNLIK